MYIPIIARTMTPPVAAIISHIFGFEELVEEDEDAGVIEGGGSWATAFG